MDEIKKKFDELLSEAKKELSEDDYALLLDGFSDSIIAAQKPAEEEDPS